MLVIEGKGEMRKVNGNKQMLGGGRINEIQSSDGRISLG